MYIYVRTYIHCMYKPVECCLCCLVTFKYARIYSNGICQNLQHTFENLCDHTFSVVLMHT